MAYLDNKLVFLSGSTGLVGSSIMKYLLDNYPTTRIRASFYNHTKIFIKNERVEYVYGDLGLREVCKKISVGCDCAIMAAANSGGSNVFTSEPWKQITDNVIMSSQQLEAFYFNNIKRVVYISSAILYQDFDKYVKEDDLDLNIDPHPTYFGAGWVQRFLEKLCKFWHDKYGMEILVLRAANIFGPYAKFDPQASNFIPALIRKAVDKKEPFEVWGTPDVTRDVIYSEDFARAIAMILDNDKIKFDTFNIGSGVQTTVRDVVGWALKYAGHKPLTIKYNSDRPTTGKFRALDCSKAKEILGWQPKYGIEEGIKKTTEWWIKNRNQWIR